MRRVGSAASSSELSPIPPHSHHANSRQAPDPAGQVAVKSTAIKKQSMNRLNESFKTPWRVVENANPVYFRKPGV